MCKPGKYKMAFRWWYNILFSTGIAPQTLTFSAPVPQFLTFPEADYRLLSRWSSACPGLCSPPISVALHLSDLTVHPAVRSPPVRCPGFSVTWYPAVGAARSLVWILTPEPTERPHRESDWVDALPTELNQRLGGLDWLWAEIRYPDD